MRLLLSRETARHVLTTASVTYIGVLLSLVAAPLVARTIGAEGRGIVAAAIAVVATLAGVSFLGLPAGMGIRLSVHGERSLSGVGIITLLGITAAIAGFAAAPFLSGGDAQTSSLIRLGSLPLVLAGLGRFGTEIAMIEGRFILYNGIRASTLVLPSGIQIGLFLTDTLTVTSSFLALIIGQVVAITAGAVVALVAVAGSKPARPPWRFSLRLWVTVTLETLTANLDIVLLTLFASPAQAGVYAVAITVGGATGGVTQALNQSQYSRFAAEVKAGEVPSLPAASRSSALTSAAVGIPAIGAIWFLAEPLFGADFATLPGVAAILIVARALQDQWRLRVLYSSATERNSMLVPAALCALLTMVSVACGLGIAGLLNSYTMGATMVAMGLVRVAVFGALMHRRPMPVS